MRHNCSVAVIIPALNEEASIGKVIEAVPSWVDEIVVADNGSVDDTVSVAEERGARVVHAEQRGYGSACLEGIAALNSPDIAVFIDGDLSDYPEEMKLLVDPIASGEAEMVIGSRVLGERERGALTPQARFGNWLSCKLMRLFWGARHTDLGPFRAIRYDCLVGLNMRDKGYGWTVEMQIKAAAQRLRVVEVPVSYRKRIGKSKISGTVRGVIGAGTKILSTIFLAALFPSFSGRPSPDRLAIFTRYPEAGKTKTRMIPALGEQGAADLQRQMTTLTVVQARELKETSKVGLEVRYFGGTLDQMRYWLGDGITYRPQGEGDLGEKLKRAFRDGFDSGVKRMVIIGSDCPELSQDITKSAFDALLDNDLVLGPASDGGYYLIGLRASCKSSAWAALFGGVDWGTGKVLQTTLEIAKTNGLTTELLPELDDVDRPEDLPIAERALKNCITSISVIIPALNEAVNIAETIKSVKQASDAEIIVVDGGSSDQTVEIATNLGATVLDCQAGRAKQMNLGAKHASGDVLLFLHADTVLPPGFETHIRKAMDVNGVVAGAFRLQIDAPGKSLRIIEACANWRSKTLQAPYGDQGIFTRASVFAELGGFPDIPIMEDFVFIRSLRKHGSIKTVSAPIKTSARRWTRQGVWKTTLLNRTTILAYHCGIKPETLRRWRNKTPAAP